LVTVGV
jgi:hypothetical protein